ncbi:MAG: MASE3 domain-containing protein [Ignavibacteria bacterium]
MPSGSSSATPLAPASPEVGRPAYDGFVVSPREAAAFGLILLAIQLTNHYGYLLFHSLIELFSVCIAVAISIIAINCWHLIRNQYVLVLGVAYFFVGLLDVLHTLSYKSMPIFVDYDYYAPQFWIAARYLESFSMLAGFLFLGSRRRLNPTAVVGVFALVTAAAIASILQFRNFPVCFVAGYGLTPFKILSEYAVCGILLVCVVLLYRRRRLFDARVYSLIQWSALLMIVSELCFTLYQSDAMSDAFNEFGHLFKAARFFLIYKALVVTGLRDPLALLFRDLKRGEDNLLEAQQLAQLGSWEWDLETDRWNWTAEIYHLFRIGNDAAPSLELLLDALPPPAREGLRAALGQCARNGTSFELMLTIAGPGGHERYAQMRGRALRDGGNITCLMGTILDVTKQQRLLNALTRAKEAADAASVAKSAFLANMSHEIRTPLNAVLGFARIGARDSQEASSRLNFGRIMDSGAHLIGVINAILDYAKMEAGKFAVEPRPFQPAAVIANARSFVLELAQQKGLECSVAADRLPEWLLGDPLRLQQILVNLLANAVKFTAEGHVRLRVTRVGDVTRYCVEDSGIGMEACEVARLFKPFEQADNSTTRNYGGTGLGLAISQSLARLMGGEITVESAPGRGSAFTLTLPLPETAAPERASSEQRQEKSLTGYRVLAAEDVDVNRLILADMLADAGATVTFAQNGKEAVEAVKARPDGFDVVLMDVQMPVMDGYEATRRIRALAPDLPVIGLTAHALAEERVKCFTVGMLEHVTKPIEPAELVAAVRRCTRMPPSGTAATPDAAERGTTGAVSVRTEIDWAALRAQMESKPGLIARLSAMALSGHGDKPVRLRAAAAAGRHEEVAWLAHALCGAAGNLKAWRVMDLARRAEAAAKRGEAGTRELAEGLADATDRMLAELASETGLAEEQGGVPPA